MKTKEKYLIAKGDRSKSIVLIKVGMFYITFNEDAEILKRIFQYKVENGKLGFPLSSLSKVVSSLDEKGINYYIIDGDEVTFKDFEINHYDEIYKLNKKLEYKDSLKKILFDRIEFLLDENEDNYDKIRKFLEEL